MIRRRVIIEQPALQQPNEYGEVTPPTWTTFAPVWATIEPLSGRQLEVARSWASTVSHRLVIPYYGGVLPTFRINVQGRIFNINAILNADAKGNYPERNRYLTFYCTEAPGSPETDGPNALETEDDDSLMTEDGRILTIEG